MFDHPHEPALTRRPLDLPVGPLAALALAGAVIALLVPVSSSGRSSVTGASLALSDSQAVTTAARVSQPASAAQGRVPLFFGFLEYDWDPHAPGGVPGFDPWPKHDLSVAETRPL